MTGGEKLISSQEVVKSYDTITSRDKAINLRKKLTEKFHGQDFMNFFTFERETTLRDDFLSILDNSAQRLHSTVVKALIDQIKNNHDFTDEINEYRTAFGSDPKTEALFASVSTPNKRNYLTALKSNPKIVELLAAARFNQIFIQLLELIFNTMHHSQVSGSLSREAQEDKQLSDLAGFQDTPTPNITGTNTQSTTSSPAQSQTPATTNSQEPRVTLNLVDKKHLFSYRTLPRIAGVISIFSSSVTGKEPFLEANNNMVNEFGVTFQGNKTLETLNEIVTVNTKQNFSSLENVQKFLTTTINPPRKIQTSNLDAILSQTKGLGLAGLATENGQQVPEKEVQEFLMRAHAMPEHLNYKDGEKFKQVPSRYLLLLTMLKSHRVEDLEFFMFHFQLSSDALKKVKLDLGLTLNPKTQAKFNQLMATSSQARIKNLERAESIFNSHFHNRLKLEKFQSSAENILHDPMKLGLIYGTYVSGISAMNAWMQNLAEMVKMRDADPSVIFKSIIRYYIFKKIFNKSFSFLGGLPNNHANDTIVETALKNLNKVSGNSELLSKDPVLSQQVVYEFYTSNSRAQNGFIQTQPFIDFIKVLFVDDSNSPVSVPGHSNGKVTPEFIKARLTNYLETASMTPEQKKSFARNFDAVLDNVSSQSSPSFGAIQLCFLSLSIRKLSLNAPKDILKITTNPMGNDLGATYKPASGK